MHALIYKSILIRQGRSLTIEVPAFHARDAFTLSGVAQALGECK
jgi:hypothetical protein